MSVFSSLFSPFSRWKENPNGNEQKSMSNEELRNYDKVETVNLEGVDEIYISSNANMVISTTTQSETKIRLHGTTSSNYPLDCYVTQIDKTLRIRAKRDESKSSNGIKEKNTTSDGQKSGAETESNMPTFVNITLEIEVPESYCWKKIKVKNTCGHIIIKTAISADEIEVLNKNGDISISSTFKKLTVDSRQGNLKIKTYANSDIDVTVNNSDGTVHMNLENIKNSYLKLQVDGAVMVQPTYDGNYDIYGTIRVNNGFLFIG